MISLTSSVILASTFLILQDDSQVTSNRNNDHGYTAEDISRLQNEGNYNVSVSIPPTRLALHFPSPISEQELAVYADLLYLSNSQRSMLNAIYSSYRTHDEEFRLEVISNISLRASYPLELDPLNAFSLEEYKEVKTDRDDAIRELVLLENEFFDRIEAILSDSQLPKLPRTKLQRERFRYNCLSSAQYPGSSVDLSTLTYEYLNEMNLPLPESGSRMFSLIEEYERAATRLLSDRFWAVLRCETDDTLLMMNLFKNPIKQSRGSLVKSWSAERQLILSKPVRISKRLHDINTNYLYLLADELPTIHGRQFVAWFRERAYPDLFPDPSDMSQLFSSFSEVDTLSNEVKAELDSIAIAWSTTHESINADLIRRSCDYVEEKESTGKIHLLVKEDHLAQLDQLRMTRLSNSSAWLQQLKSILTPEQLEGLKEELTPIEAALAEH